MHQLTTEDEATVAMFRAYLREHSDFADEVVEADVVAGGLKFHFAGVRAEVFFLVRTDGIVVPVESDGELYDFLINLDVRLA
jgi:hypothetical protein